MAVALNPTDAWRGKACCDGISEVKKLFVVIVITWLLNGQL